jgi:hypothetical protein
LEAGPDDLDEAGAVATLDLFIGTFLIVLMVFALVLARPLREAPQVDVKPAAQQWIKIRLTSDPEIALAVILNCATCADQKTLSIRTDSVFTTPSGCWQAPSFGTSVTVVVCRKTPPTNSLRATAEIYLAQTTPGEWTYRVAYVGVLRGATALPETTPVTASHLNEVGEVVQCFPTASILPGEAYPRSGCSVKVRALESPQDFDNFQLIYGESRNAYR